MTHPSHNERGFALIMTIFIIALASILVMGFAQETFEHQRAVRSYTERIQADYVIKSAFNLAKVLLELPKAEGVKEDWLGEPWALIAGAPALPITGISGEVRLMIVDESGKINANAILGENVLSYPGEPSPPQAPGQTDSATFWKESLRNLFYQAGFAREQYSKDRFRTLGNVAFDPEEQVAVIHDWIDHDLTSHSSPTFGGRGIESSADKTWFYNRPMRNIAELALVPGMTLERTALAAPFLRVSQQPRDYQININTAPLEVLTAIGIPEAEARDIFTERTNLPFTNEMVKKFQTANPQLARVLTVKSQQFTAYAMVKMASVTRWAKATINVYGGHAYPSSIELL